MRACIAGGGLAGSLLAWRLAQARGWQIDLVLGERQRSDATAASGGAVRAFERHPEQRRLAVASMVELLGSQTLRRWADFRLADSVYLSGDAGGLDAAVAEIEGVLPGSAQVVGAADLSQAGWAGVPSGAAAVLERHAGYTAPDHLRAAVLADGVRRRVTVVEAAVGGVTVGGRGLLACTVAGERREYDVVVLAAGAWTARLLAASGLPAAGYRTKSIQYSVYLAEGPWRPPMFVDDTTGLYGRPSGDDALLLGLATDLWDVDPDRPPVTPGLHETAARLARERFPRLWPGRTLRRLASADCYAEQPVLALRRVIDTTDHRLFAFSGGAGGSVKTALAASHQAATQLIESGHTTDPGHTADPGRTTDLTSVGNRKGQP